MEKGKNYTKELPRELYLFFIRSTEDGNIPSITKFARHKGFTTEELLSFRKHREFDLAWKEAIEIRRDYLIDSALTKRFDPSFVKFLFGVEFGIGEDNKDDDISVTIKVLEG